MLIRYAIVLLLSISAKLLCLPNGLKEKIVEYKKDHSGQLSLAERLYMAEVISVRQGCNLLIFGVGDDTSLWLDINKNGRTVFLEDHKDWMEKVQKKCPDAEIYEVYYGTKRKQWQELLRSEDRSTLDMNLPGQIEGVNWDVILVDAPTGFDENAVGRMKSIFKSAKLAKSCSPVDIFVHDCNRVVENVYSNTFLGQDHLVYEIDRLRHYRIS